MAEPRWVTINGHHVLINADEVSDTGKSNAKKGKNVPGKGAVKDVKGKKWHSETEEERAAIDKRMENARKIGIKNDVYGQLGFGNFSDEALEKAVNRGWITQEQSDKISGKTKSAAIKSPGSKNKSEYIISKNINGQELKIPRKTYEQRLERAKKYKQELYDMANRPHSRYKLNPDDIKKAEEEIKRLKKILQLGKD